MASIPVVAAWLYVATTHPGTRTVLFTLAIALAATLVGVAASTIVARESNVEDPSHVVIDEVAGQSIALLGATVADWRYALAAFILFRAFDILKPPPVRQLERLPRGWGIMMDDVAAGVLALMVLRIAAFAHLFR
jgi:phosphatidylglycerophosphatase A